MEAYSGRCQGVTPTQDADHTEQSLQACAVLVQKGDPDRFAAALASPVAARRVILPVQAFCLEVARAPWVTQEPLIAEMRLQWWFDVLDEIASEAPTRRHEVVDALDGALQPDQARALHKTVAARKWDIGRNAFEDEAAFWDYIDATAWVPIAVAMTALGAGEPLLTQARPWARALGLTRFFAAVPALEAAGRVPLVDGRPEAVQRLAQTTLDALPRWRGLRGDKLASAPVLEACWAKSSLQQVVRTPARVSAGEMGVSEFSKRLRLLIA